MLVLALEDLSLVLLRFLLLKKLLRFSTFGQFNANFGDSLFVVGVLLEIFVFCSFFGGDVSPSLVVNCILSSTGWDISMKFASSVLHSEVKLITWPLFLSRFVPDVALVFADLCVVAGVNACN